MEAENDSRAAARDALYVKTEHLSALTGALATLAVQGFELKDLVLQGLLGLAEDLAQQVRDLAHSATEGGGTA